ncbi:MAG TPA: SagB/ThcOx family dehydrogenase [Candidatus Ozemobacteraceae bacterium]|nr:SagB/ThcOx family dehydrogenase [Candidatus Ozemobacteraceae bacterium]
MKSASDEDLRSSPATPPNRPVKTRLAFAVAFAGGLLMTGLWMTMLKTTSFAPRQTFRSDVIPLPASSAATGLTDVLKQRRTKRDFTAGCRITLEEINSLLWAAQGVTSPEGFRTAPSAGALYPLELVVAAGNVGSLTPGLYRYQPGESQLSPGAAGDFRGPIADAAYAQSWMAECAAVIAVCGVVDRVSRKYGSRGERYTLIEAGHAGQNIMLMSAALGLKCGIIGAFDDERLHRQLGLAPDERVITLFPVGR